MKNEEQRLILQLQQETVDRPIRDLEGLEKNRIIRLEPRISRQTNA